MRNPNGPSIEEKAAMQDELEERSEAMKKAEREFLNASIAVWREIDRLMSIGPYPGIHMAADLRITEKLAWERYRSFLDMR